jgi:predicted RNase H-like HicB family nuclease
MSISARRRKPNHIGRRDFAVPQRRSGILRCQRPGEEIALGLTATPIPQEVALRLSFDPFRDDGDLQLTRQTDGCPNDGGVTGRGFQIGDEILGDLDAMAEFHYTVVLEPGDPDEGGFVVSVPALPEAHTQGDSLEEALANAREVIELCILSRREHGEDIPSSDFYATRMEGVVISLPPA